MKGKPSYYIVRCLSKLSHKYLKYLKGYLNNDQGITVNRFGNELDF